MKARLIEIFSSIQGEGLWIGKPQVFVRFHGCKLKCQYCDTPLTHHQIQQARIEYPPYSQKFENHALEFSIDELNQTIKRFGIQSLALTGGEPLEQADFIAEWLAHSDYEVLLETSGIEHQAYQKVLPFIAMTSFDIKLPSATGEKDYWTEHDAFIKQVPPHSYAKIVYDEKMTSDEIARLTQYLKDYSQLNFIFQPISPLRHRDMSKCLALFNLFAEGFADRVRLIGQMHKAFGVL